MEFGSILIFVVSCLVVFYGMVGYPLTLIIIDKIFKPKENQKNTDYEPKISYIIVAHNEELVIEEKLENAIAMDYPINKFQIIVASDNSTDNTNKIVNNFILENKEFDISLCCSKEHKGKTNAQNEAQKKCIGEIVVMTDANSILERSAIKELVSYFASDDVAYVCGSLVYKNSEYNETSNSESTYWNLDMYMRNIESRIKSITAGNGALYAVRNEYYIDFEPIYCHDSIMPYTYAKQGKRSLYNPNAIAYEKAGENNEDEYRRKVRMNRDILDMLFWSIQISNPFKYGCLSLFYFGHRTCRYLLWLSHIFMLISSLYLSLTGNYFWIFVLLIQLFCFAISMFSIRKTKNIRFPLFRVIEYYCMTVVAQFHGVINMITGKSKPVWEKAESTR